MALVTYILLAALYSGLNARFHPEILGVTASKAIAVVLLDLVFVKGGCYLLNIPVSAVPYRTYGTSINNLPGRSLQPVSRSPRIWRLQVRRVRQTCHQTGFLIDRWSILVSSSPSSPAYLV